MAETEKSAVIVDVSNHQRLDIYLSHKLGYTRTKIKKLIKSGFVEVNGGVKNSHYRVEQGEKITYFVPDNKKNTMESQPIPFKIIFKNKSFAVIDKPPGLVVHPAPGNRDGTLLNGLLEEFDTPHLVHRLDKDTSGVMVVALDEKTALDLRKQFKEKTVKKVYLTLLDGIIDTDAGEISVPIRRSRRDPTKMGVGWSNARKSSTRFRVKKRLNGATFVEVYPLSGRTHQIRVHFAYYGHPVLGDTKYGKKTFKAPRQMLHSWQISFGDPKEGIRVHFDSPIPDDFKRFKKLLEKNDKILL